MATFRCREEHSEELLTNPRTRVNYVARVEPINYPGTSVICGRGDCKKPGLAHFNEDEWQKYQQGECIFDLYETTAAKFKVGENAETIERHNDGIISFRRWRGS
jgi:hypothetical protein